MLAGTALPGWAAASLNLDVSFDEGAFPLQYGLADGTAAGLYPLIVAAVGQRLGWALQLRARPFKRILSDLASGDTCAGALVRTPEREAYALFSNPYYTERLQVYSMRGAARPFQGLSDLAGRRVGVIRGWSYGAEFDAARQIGGFEVEEVATDRQNFVKLFRERLDYVIAPELAGRLLQRSAPAGTHAVEGERHMALTPIHFCVWHGMPRAVERMADFNAALRELMREGVVARLVERERQRQMP